MPDAGYRVYSDGLVLDRDTVFLTPVLCLLGLLCVACGATLTARIAPHVAQYHATVLLAVLGASLLVAAREMVALWVALELLSVSLAVLVAMVKTDRRGSEAAIKQLVIGAVASAVLLYGFAILYGIAGSTVLVEVAAQLRHPTAASSLGLALVVGAMLVKLGLVPFHQWVPDTARGAPPAVGGLVIALGSTAVAASLARVVVTTFGAQSDNWRAMVALVAALSMIVGTVGAFSQTSLRRLLGMLAVSQVGFVLVGALAYADDQKGIAALLFGLATQGITVSGLFAGVALLEAGVGDDLDDLRGLSRRSPLAATMVALGTLSLVGVPPLIGFFAKLFVLQAAVLAGYAWLVLLALVTSVAAAVPSMRLVKAMFVDRPDEDAPRLDPAPPALRVAAGLCALATVLLGAAAQPLFALASGGAGSIH